MHVAAPKRVAKRTEKHPYDRLLAKEISRKEFHRLIDGRPHRKRNGFVKLPLALLEDERLQIGARLVAAELLSYAWEGLDDRCFPSQPRIAENLGISLREVQRHVRTLKELELVEVAQRRNNSAVYNVSRLRSMVGVSTKDPVTRGKTASPYVMTEAEKAAKDAEEEALLEQLFGNPTRPSKVPPAETHEDDEDDDPLPF